jgi:hypothetical protein
MKFLDDLPLASLTFIAGVVLTVIAYVSNDVGYQDALVALGALGGGTGALGYVRNQAGRGLRK